MNKLAGIMRDFADFGEHLGPGESPPEIDGFRRNLELLRRENQTFLRAVAVMVGVVFLTSLILLIVFRQNPQLVAGIFGASGVTLAWAINKMHRLWRDKAHADLLFAMVGEVDDDVLRSVVGVLVESLFGRPES